MPVSPIETVGNSQNSGISRGCGYDESPLPTPCWTSWRKCSSCCSVEPALEEGAGVDARRAVALDVDLVAAAGVVLAAEEVVEADLVEAGRRLVRRDVAADLEAGPVRVGDHHRGVPADEGADPALDLLVAGEPRLALRRDGVDVVGAAQRGHADVQLAGLLEQPQHHVARPVAAALVDQLVERLEPVGGLVRVDVRELGGQPLVDHRRGRAAGGGSGGGLVGNRVGGCFLGHPLIVSRLAEPDDASISLPTSTTWLPCSTSQVGTDVCAAGSRSLARAAQLRWTSAHWTPAAAGVRHR